MDQVTAVNKSDSTVVCYAPTLITTNGIWQGDNPLNYSLPLFILQLTLVVVTTRILVFILKPLRQPRVISEILVSISLLTFSSLSPFTVDSAKLPFQCPWSCEYELQITCNEKT